MNICYILSLLVFLVLMAGLLIHYVHATVDSEFRKLARAASDKEYRGEELRKIDALLARSLPLPTDIPPVPKPEEGKRIFAPILLAVGIILLWGGVFAREERGVWFYGGIGSCLLATVIMLATLRRRKRERLARLLRFRADLRRLDGARGRTAEDLRELLKLTPWDDAAWAELSDDLAAEGDLNSALEAVRHAARLDPRYDEYQIIQVSLALRLGKPDLAKSAISAWKNLDNAGADDPRLVIYRAAIELAEGRREEAAKSLQSILLDADGAPEYLDTDQALEGIKGLLQDGV